jgi:hypothetical protein
MNQDNYSDMFEPAVNFSPVGVNGTVNSEGVCVDHETVITDVQLAHGYVPFQKLCPTFTPMNSLRNGTIFPGLYDPRWDNKQWMGGE